MRGMFTVLLGLRDDLSPRMINVVPDRTNYSDLGDPAFGTLTPTIRGSGLPTCRRA
jgi:hypothetical protein